jgi:hypothetical protein
VTVWFYFRWTVENHSSANWFIIEPSEFGAALVGMTLSAGASASPGGAASVTRWVWVVRPTCQVVLLMMVLQEVERRLRGLRQAAVVRLAWTTARLVVCLVVPARMQRPADGMKAREMTRVSSVRRRHHLDA